MPLRMARSPPVEPTLIDRTLKPFSAIISVITSMPRQWLPMISRSGKAIFSEKSRHLDRLSLLEYVDVCSPIST